MSRTSSQPRLVLLMIVLGAAVPLETQAGEKNRKGEGAKATNAAGNVAAAEHKAMVHQQQQAAMRNKAAMHQQRQAAMQHKLALQQQNSTGLNNGTERRLTDGGERRLNGTGMGVGHRNGVGTGHNRNMETGPMVSSLHSVVGHLHQADHDYDGHRVQAIHQIDQAVQALHSGTGATAGRANGAGTGANLAQSQVKNGTNSTGKLGASGAGATRMSQAESDAHLREAHRELQELEGRMSTGGNLAAHHQQAHGHIQQALQHLNTALATR